MEVKSTFQKLYEKMAIAKRNSDYLGVMYAEDDDGKACLVLCCDTKPLAVLLDKPGIDRLTPHFEISEAINAVMQNALDHDDRIDLDEFDKPHPVEGIFKNWMDKRFGADRWTSNHLEE